MYRQDANPKSYAHDYDGELMQKEYEYSEINSLRIHTLEKIIEDKITQIEELQKQLKMKEEEQDLYEFEIRELDESRENAKKMKEHIDLKEMEISELRTKIANLHEKLNTERERIDQKNNELNQMNTTVQREIRRMNAERDRNAKDTEFGENERLKQMAAQLTEKDTLILQLELEIESLKKESIAYMNNVCIVERDLKEKNSREYETYMGLVNDLRRSNEELKLQMRRDKAQENVLKEQIVAIEEVLTSKKEAMSRMEDEIKKVYSSNSEYIDKLRNEAKILQQDKYKMTEELDEFKIKLNEERIREIEGKDKEIERIKRENSTKIAILENEISKMREENSSIMKSEQASKNALIQKEKSCKDEIDKVYDTFAKRILILEIQNKEQESQLNSKHNECNKLTEEIKQINHKLSESEQEHKNLQSRMGALESKRLKTESDLLKAKTAELTTLQQKCNSLISEVNEKSQQLGSKESEVSSLKKRVEDLKNELTLMRNEIKMRNTYQQIASGRPQDESLRLPQRNDLLFSPARDVESLDKSREEVIHLKQTIDDFSKDRKSVSARHSSATDDLITRLNEENEQLRIQIYNLEIKLKTMEDQKNSLEFQLRESKNDSHSLKKVIHTQEKHIFEMNSQYEQAQQNIELLKSNRTALVETCSDLKAALTQAKHKKASQSSEVDAGQGVPSVLLHTYRKRIADLENYVEELYDQLKRWSQHDIKAQSLAAHIGRQGDIRVETNESFDDSKKSKSNYSPEKTKRQIESLKFSVDDGVAARDYDTFNPKFIETREMDPMKETILRQKIREIKGELHAEGQQIKNTQEDQPKKFGKSRQTQSQAKIFEKISSINAKRAAEMNKPKVRNYNIRDENS